MLDCISTPQGQVTIDKLLAHWQHAAEATRPLLSHLGVAACDMVGDESDLVLVTEVMRCWEWVERLEAQAVGGGLKEEIVKQVNFPRLGNVA